jgi:hypothetical protein
MTALDWRPLKGVDFARLQDARLQAHHAAQWLSRAAYAFISPNPDDSHSNLGWDETFNGLATHKLQGARIGLKLFPFSLAILEGMDAPPTRILNLDGHKEADLRAWLGEELGSLGLDARLLDKPPPYKIPPHKGVTTGILRTHLGLIVPKDRENCTMTVGDEVCVWEQGKAFVFDDTYRHHVWNNTDEERVILIFDFNRPMRLWGRMLNQSVIWIVKQTAFFKEPKRRMKSHEERFEAAVRAADNALEKFGHGAD